MKMNGLFVLALSSLLASSAGQQTALDRYVAQPDPVFSWDIVKEIEGDGYRAHVLEMTSQKWLTEAEVDKPVWKHWVTVIRPEKVSTDTGLLFITGGSNERPAPSSADQNLVRVAVATHSVVAELRMVPNQPLTFAGEEKGRSEDALIAYTWDQYLRTGDERWPARLPMTKSAVRAMDAITAFCATSDGGENEVDQFVVAGASKRGWTTWSTAAVDKRVVAIVPIVIDLLNVTPSFKHHWSAYGFWAPAVHDYVQMGIMDWMDTPEFAALMKIEEPFEYRDRFTMPKLLINSTGDQFFLPDSSQFYFDQLPGPKYLRYVPNSDHSLKNTDALASLLAFYDAILHDRSLPEFTWDSPRPGTLVVQTKTKPAEVRLWQATNPEARDFRLDVLGPAYRSTRLDETAPGVYEAEIATPAKGWTAFFIELTFQTETAPLKLTTQIYVIPEKLPFSEDLPSGVAPAGFLSGRSK